MSPQEIEELEKSFNAVEMLIGATMKRLLAVNDLYGSRTMRESILDEMNKVNRFVQSEHVRLCPSES